MRVKDNRRRSPSESWTLADPALERGHQMPWYRSYDMRPLLHAARILMHIGVHKVLVSAVEMRSCAMKLENLSQPLERYGGAAPFRSSNVNCRR